MKILNIIDDVETDHLINNNKKIEILNWNRNKSVNFESIITYIEKKDDFFKKKYVSFISKIKNHLFNKKSLYKNFNIENKFSLWEMSLFEEKNIYKNPEIIDLIKILALREIVKEKKIKKIIIFSNNKKLGTNISSLINNVKVELNYFKKKKNDTNYFLKNNIFYFFYFLLNFFFKRFKFKRKTFGQMKNAILICDYFTYFDEDKASKGFYISNYWKKLLPLIKKKKINLNFLHLALDEKKYNLKNKIKVLDKFNVASRMSHNILDSYIDFTILAKVTYEWFLNCFKYFYLKIMHNNNYIFQNYLLKKMFVDSFIGVWSIKNLYFFYLFEKFFKETQQNNKVITYVSEFQSWEKLIFFNSNKQQSKNIFALQFNPIRNWDLRYQFEISKDNINLYPKKIITFYNSSKKNLIKAFSKSKKIKVFLSDNLRPLDYSFKKKFKKKKILIVGDHDDSSTLNLLKIVNKLLEQKSKYLFEYKPHPISKIKISNFDNLQKLKVYWDNKCFEYMYDAFIVSNKTSLGLELSNKGFKTGVILDSKSLNLSPLDKNYQFLIKNEIELNNFINVKKSHNSAIKIRNIISWNNIVNKWLKIIKYE